MRRLHRHLARHHQVEVHKGHAAGGTQAHVVRLDRAAAALGDGVAQHPDVAQVRHLVHQPADRGAQHPIAGAQDVERHQRRHRRIEPAQAGQRHQGEAEQHGERGPHVGHDVPAAGQQRRGPGPPALAKQHQRPDEVDGTARGVDADAEPRRPDVRRMVQPLPGGAADHERGGEHQPALDDGAEILRLVVAVAVVGVGRTGAVPQGEQGGAGGRHVDHGFQRVGVERHAAGQPVGGGLDRQHQQADGEAGPGDAERPIHTDPLLAPVPARMHHDPAGRRKHARPATPTGERQCRAGATRREDRERRA